MIFHRLALNFFMEDFNAENEMIEFILCTEGDVNCGSTGAAHILIKGALSIDLGNRFKG